MFDVIGVGSAFVDYFFEANTSFLKKLNLKPEDDFLFKDKNITPDYIFENLSLLSKSPGGICPNTLSVLSNLGIKTSYYGVLGNDEDGNFWLKNIGKIDTSMIKRIGKTSICACILTNQRKNRLFLSQVNPEDNAFFKTVNYSLLSKAKFIHSGPFLLDTNKNILELEKLFNKIKHPKISFSPNLPYVNLGLKKISPLLKKTYVLFLNENEVKYLTDKNSQEGSKDLLKYGPKIIVCTMGNNGAQITTKDKQIFSPGLKVKNIIDTTGAGDAFAAGFLYGIFKKRSLEWSADFANKLAAISVTDFGLHWLKKLDKKTVDKSLNE